MANTMQDLLSQYTQNINVDPRVFSQDVMTQDAFAAPFEAWTQNAINSYLLPEFMRYSYDPTMQKMQEGLYNTNQNIGLSGAWRGAQAQVDMNNAANEAMRAQEQLTRGFNDQALQTRDAFKSAWSDPLYKRQMETFYTAPWNQTEGGNAQPVSQPSLPELQGYNSTNQPAGTFQPFTPFTGGNNLATQYNATNGINRVAGSNGLPTTQFQGDRDLINQYMKPLGGQTRTPVGSNQAYNILAQA